MDRTEYCLKVLAKAAAAGNQSEGNCTIDALYGDLSRERGINNEPQGGSRIAWEVRGILCQLRDRLLHEELRQTGSTAEKTLIRFRTQLEDYIRRLDPPQPTSSI
jgi:hypothetical protein